MRISDWSSDVCSSDLAHVVGGGVDVAGQALQLDADRQAALQFGQQVARLGHREGAGRDEQDMVCFYSPVFRVDDSALDPRQQVALHALPADIAAAAVFAAGAELVDLAEEDAAVLLDRGADGKSDL